VASWPKSLHKTGGTTLAELNRGGSRPYFE
jgi:hypothetical protein